MRIDFEEITPSRNKIKVIAIVILVILFIGLFALLGMYYGKLYNFSFSLKNITFLNGFIQEENAIKEENYEKNSKLPIYTKEAKEGMNNIYNKNSKIAYLTFDDGPSEVVTNLILDVLKEHNVSTVYYGHIHGSGSYHIVKEFEGIKFHLISCDSIEFTPYFIA